MLPNLINRLSPTSALEKLQIGIKESAAVYHEREGRGLLHQGSGNKNWENGDRDTEIYTISEQTNT